MAGAFLAGAFFAAVVAGLFLDLPLAPVVPVALRAPSPWRTASRLAFSALIRSGAGAGASNQRMIH